MRQEEEDGRDFTEEEYKHELDLHHIAIPKYMSARAVYMGQDAKSVKKRPRSAVFRDFELYGVHPARVAVLYMKLTIPFLIQSLSSSQVKTEIIEQRYHKKKGDDGTSKPEEKEHGRAGYVISTEYIRNPPTIDAAFDLINTLSKRERYIPYTPPLQKVMSALNLYYYVFGSFVLPTQYLIPDRETLTNELLLLVRKEIVLREIEGQIYEDPRNWGRLKPSSITIDEILDLLTALMTTRVSTSQMRLIITWYKAVNERRQTYALIYRILENSDRMIQTVQVAATKWI